MTIMYRLLLSKQANDFFESLNGKHRAQMENALNLLSKDPAQGKPLKGELKGYWSFRVGINRIIYSILEKEILIRVLRIQHRKEVYEKFKG